MRALALVTVVIAFIFFSSGCGNAGITRQDVGQEIERGLKQFKTDVTDPLRDVIRTESNARQEADRNIMDVLAELKKECADPVAPTGGNAPPAAPAAPAVWPPQMANIPVVPGINAQLTVPSPDESELKQLRKRTRRLEDKLDKAHERINKLDEQTRESDRKAGFWRSRYAQSEERQMHRSDRPEVEIHIHNEQEARSSAVAQPRVTMLDGQKVQETDRKRRLQRLRVCAPGAG